jgi:NADP-reducing hydrogenase subunit HndB
MKSLEDLEKIRNEAKERLRLREGSQDTRIVVGMGTCGIAAGAREVVAALLDEAAKRKLQGVSVTQTGCVGLCEYEPLVFVYTQDGKKVTYKYVNAEKARQIIAQHIVNGRPVTEWVLAD